MNEEKIVTTRVSLELYEMIQSICREEKITVTKVMQHLIQNDVSLETYFLKVHNK